jgi:hypothetical protein
MSEDGKGTLNGSQGDTQTDQESSDLELKELGGLVSTVAEPTDTEPERANNIEDQPKKKEEAAAGEQKPPEKKEEKVEQPKEELGGQDDRFDKHPAWQKMRQEISDLRTQNTTLQNQINSRQTERAEKEAEDFKNILDLTDDEIREWRTNDEKGFAANLLRQARSEVRADLTGQLKNEKMKEKALSTFQNFAESHQDFGELWNTGKISMFMAQHPGHNAISAYYEITKTTRDDDVKKQIEDAKKQAAEEAEKRTLANIKAKGGAKVLEAGPSARTAGGQINKVPPELRETKKHGGTVKVLTDRLLKRRAEQTA